MSSTVTMPFGVTYGQNGNFQKILQTKWKWL